MPRRRKPNNLTGRDKRKIRKDVKKAVRGAVREAIVREEDRIRASRGDTGPTLEESIKARKNIENWRPMPKTLDIGKIIDSNTDLKAGFKVMEKLKFRKSAPRVLLTQSLEHRIKLEREASDLIAHGLKRASIENPAVLEFLHYYPYVEVSLDKKIIGFMETPDTKKSSSVMLLSRGVLEIQ